MSLEELKPALDALSAWSGEEVHISVKNANETLGAWVEFTGVLGSPEFDGTHMWLPVDTPPRSERSGLSIDPNYFESWGQMHGRVRLVADGTAILCRLAT
jgi:hypothetical protein